jgi:hypothetical protein
MKSQIPSTKIQTNLKFQFPMFKTPTTVLSQRWANLGLPIMLPLDNTAEESIVWNSKLGL